MDYVGIGTTYIYKEVKIRNTGIGDVVYSNPSILWTYLRTTDDEIFFTDVLKIETSDFL